MNQIKNKYKAMRKRMKEKTQGPADFLQAGTLGGIVLCTILTSFFVCGNIIADYLTNVSVIISAIISVVLVIFLSEILFFIVRILFGSAKHSRIYWLVAFAFVFLSNLIANQTNAIVITIIMSFVLAVAVNFFGKCIWAFIKTKKFQQIFGYVVGSISLIIIILFVIFWNYDHFGKSRIAFYMENTPEYHFNTVAGFDQYLENGSYDVGYLSYAPQNADVITDTLDMTEIVKRQGIKDALLDLRSKYEIEKVPIAGGIWYPKNLSDCPVLFIVHGAHSAKTESYLGYDYLGEYLASNGYVVVSVDENIVNSLDMGNDTRAIILLENMKTILELNKNQNSPLYGKMNEKQLAIAGHSRGGEMVATAYLFNDLDAYPENGNVKFDYHFPISAVIAIAPTVDQYMPVEHAVQIQDVNYMVLHGSNDQDVSIMMGEKQYKNVSFTDQAGSKCKASVYIMGANHGQFNSRWGRYDMIAATNGYLNTNHFLAKREQQLIAKAYIRTFLDLSLLKDDTYKNLLVDNRPYLDYLPKTVYMTDYMDASYEKICSFDESVDLHAGDSKDVWIDCTDMSDWTVQPEYSGLVMQEENYVLDCTWDDEATPTMQISMTPIDLSNGCLSFRIADMREGIADENNGIDYTVTFIDTSGNKVSSKCPRYIYPSLALQLYKQDVLAGSYEYRHQMQKVMVSKDSFEIDGNFDISAVCGIVFEFDGKSDGEVIIDDVAYREGL